TCASWHSASASGVGLGQSATTLVFCSGWAVTSVGMPSCLSLDLAIAADGVRSSRSARGRGSGTAKFLAAAQSMKSLSGLVGGRLDHNLAAQAIAVVDDNHLLRTWLHGVGLLQDFGRRRLHYGCLLQSRWVDVRASGSKHQGLQHGIRSFVIG